jgi:hypothetical protein
MRKTILRILFSLALPATLYAQLSWDKTRIEATVPVEQGKLQADFHFRNAGTEAITILNVSTSCGCTTATLKKRTYAPAEEGDITVIFDFEGRTGRHEKTIQVTASGSTESTLLVLDATISEVFTLKPRILLWKVDESVGGVKTAILLASRGVPLKPISVQCDRPGFEVQMFPITPGSRYELQVTAKSTATTQRATIRIELENENGKRTTCVVYALVQ